MGSYKAELIQKVKLAKSALEDYRIECRNMSIKDKDFDVRLKKLNSLRIDYKTALSRKENYNNKKTFGEEVSLPKYQK